jgi:hypothetical protein
MRCKWVPYQDKFKCLYCNFIVSKNTINKVCKAQTQPLSLEEHMEKSKTEIPNFLQRGMNLGKAIVNHISTGMHHCTFEEKQSRFETCQSNECGLFKVHGEGGICSHDDCGCYIRSNGKFMDKLSWAESKCPVGKWGPIEQKTQESPENGV